MPHPVVAATGKWRPRAARSDLDARACAECGRLGWLNRRGRLDAEVVAALGVLCRASVEYFGWVNDGTKTTGLLTAAVGREALLATRDGDLVRLSQVRADTLPETLVEQIAEVPAARTQSVRVARAELAATTRDGRRRSEGGVGSYPASEPARQARQLVDLPMLGTGELHVVVRDQVGRRRTLPEPVRYADTSHGRYGYQVSEEQVMIVGVTRADLVARLRDAYRALARRSG